MWNSELQPGSKQLTLRNTRTLRMADDVLCIRISPDGKYVAVALLDSTIKVSVDLIVMLDHTQKLLSLQNPFKTNMMFHCIIMQESVIGSRVFKCYSLV